MSKFLKLFFNDKENDRIIISISNYELDFYDNKLKTLNKMVNIAKDDFQFIDDEDIEIETSQNHLIIKFISKQKKIPIEYLENPEKIAITDFNKLRQEQNNLLKYEKQQELKLNVMIEELKIKNKVQ